MIVYDWHHEATTKGKPASEEREGSRYGSEAESKLLVLSQSLPFMRPGFTCACVWGHL